MTRDRYDMPGQRLTSTPETYERVSFIKERNQLFPIIYSFNFSNRKRIDKRKDEVNPVTDPRIYAKNYFLKKYFGRRYHREDIFLHPGRRSIHLGRHKVFIGTRY